MGDIISYYKYIFGCLVYVGVACNLRPSSELAFRPALMWGVNGGVRWFQLYPYCIHIYHNYRYQSVGTIYGHEFDSLLCCLAWNPIPAHKSSWDPPLISVDSEFWLWSWGPCSPVCWFHSQKQSAFWDASVVSNLRGCCPAHLDWIHLPYRLLLECFTERIKVCTFLFAMPE